MKKQLNVLLLLALLTQACIQDDVIFDTVVETLQITNPIDTLGLGDTYQFETRYTNNIGQVEEPQISWSSSDPLVASIDAQGAVTGEAQGVADIYSEVIVAGNLIAADTLPLIVADETTQIELSERTGTIAATSFYTLEGDFIITQEESDLVLAFADNYEADRALPGLYVYLTNNPNSISGALEIGEVTTFSGAHSYTIEEVDIKAYDYVLYFCKPFRVKVGDGEIN